MSEATPDARELLRAQLAQRAAEQRVNNPLVRNGSCIICNVPVKTEPEWTAHSASRAHRQRIQELQEKKAAAAAAAKARASMPPPPPQGKATAKRAAPDDGAGATGSADAKRARPGGEPAKAPASLVAYGEEEDEESGGEDGDDDDAPALPARPPAAPVARQPEPAAAPAPSGPVLPKGFFDDADADARARGEETPAERMAREMTEFQKAMRGADLESAEIRDADLQETYEEREEEEAIEQRRLADQVDRLKQSAAALRARLDAARDARPALPSLDEPGDEEEPDLLDWRCKRLA